MAPFYDENSSPEPDALTVVSRITPGGVFDGEDIAQECVLRALRYPGLHEYPPHTQLFRRLSRRGFTWAVFCDLMRQTNRARGRWLTGERYKRTVLPISLQRRLDRAIPVTKQIRQIPLSPLPSPPAAAQSAEVREILRVAVARLPRQQRRIIEMSFWGHLSLDDIGRAFHVTDSRICQIRRAALRTLRRRLRRNPMAS